MKTIGIVGGGITGLTCAYKLQNEFEVTLFEKDCNLGGQAQTAEVNGITVEHAVAVVAELTYVEFFKIMKEIGFDEFKPYALNGLHVCMCTIVQKSYIISIRTFVDSVACCPSI